MNKDVHHIYRVTQIIERKPSEEMLAVSLQNICRWKIYDNFYGNDNQGLLRRWSPDDHSGGSDFIECSSVDDHPEVVKKSKRDNHRPEHFDRHDHHLGRDHDHPEVVKKMKWELIKSRLINIIIITTSRWDWSVWEWGELKVITNQ